MTVRTLTNTEELTAYEQWVKAHPQGTLWQSLEWKAYQEALGREVKIYVAASPPPPTPSLQGGVIQASAMAIVDTTAFGLSTWDIVRGPLEAISGKREVISSKLLEHIVGDAKQQQCISLYYSLPKELPAYRFPLIASSRHQQPEATLVIDLTQPEGQILAAMHQKARYNIKVAKNHGVTVTEHHGNDTEPLDAFYTLVSETGDRDGFQHLPKSHYKAFLEHLDQSFLLLAWHEKKPIAGLIGVIWNGIGMYYYGASAYAHRALMGPYALQWEAMKRCKAAGCRSYDLLGVSKRVMVSPDESMTRSDHVSSFDRAQDDTWSVDPWAGITEFKRKFGGTVVTYPPEQEIVLRPTIKQLLQWKRKILG